MSLWEIGEAELSNDTILVKNKLSAQESQLAAQESQLLKQAEDFRAIQTTLTETFAKLAKETERVSQLEADLARYTNDLTQERVSSQNLQSLLLNAQSQAKEKDREARDLEATLASMSDSSSDAQSRGKVVEKQRDEALRRIRELEIQITHPQPPESSSHDPNPESTFLSDQRISSLESQLLECEAQLKSKGLELAALDKKLLAARSEQAKAENAKVALERYTTQQIRDLSAIIEEKEDEIAFLRDQEGVEQREKELLQRIDEDGARIASLEALLQADDPRHLRAELSAAHEEIRLRVIQLQSAEESNVNLVQEKEEALNMLDAAKAQVKGLESRSPASHNTDELTADTMQTLLDAVKRLREERDDLRRKVEFLEPESRFALQALEAEASCKNDSQRLSRFALASTIIIGHLHSQLLTMQEDPARASTDHSSQSLPSSCSQETLIRQLDEKEATCQELQTLNDTLQEQIRGLEHSLDNAETTHDSLSLRIAHLERDVAIAQTDLSKAESRYASLQFHQLSEMTSNEATHALKDQINELEMRVARRTEQIGIHQHDIGRLETNLRVAEERVSEMTSELETKAAENEAMVEDCAAAREARDDALQRLECLEEELEDHQSRLAQSENSLVAATLVLVQSASRCRRLHNSNDALDQQLCSAIAGHRVLTSELANLRANFESREEELSNGVNQAIIALAINRAAHQSLLRTKASLHSRISSLHALLESEKVRNESLVAQLSTPRAVEDHVLISTHLEELSNLNTQLSATNSELQDVKAALLAKEQEFDARSSSLAQELSSQINCLQNDLGSASADRDAAHRALESTKISLDALAKKLEEREAQLGLEILSLETDLLKMRNQQQATASELTEAQSQVSELRVHLTDSETRLAQEREEHRCTLDSHQDRLNIATTDAASLADKLSIAQERVQALDNEIQTLQQLVKTQDDSARALSKEIEQVRTTSEQLEVHIQERDVIIEELRADIVDYHSTVQSVSEQRSRLEGKLSLATAHYQRQVDAYEAQLENLRSRPDMEKAIHDLEERNNEMEELLRQKCAEIEENDDRVLERVKENKKLNAKVESLTRKVQNLQSKLAAAKATSQGTPPPRTAVSRNASPPPPEVRPPLVEETPRFESTTPGRSISSSYIPRPKTPERRSLPPPQSPQRRSPHPPMPPVSAIGRKRPAPEDFEPIPTQAFTSDCKPSAQLENDTPRARKILSNIQSGFTPTRHALRPVIPSPRREGRNLRARVPENLPTHPIAHLSEQPMKRSWLGKIRGASHITTPTQVGSSKSSFPLTH